MTTNNKYYHVFVIYGVNNPLIVASGLSLDSDYKIYYDLSDTLSKGVAFYDDGKAFKTIKKSLSYNKSYKVIKMEV
jgi:hypothetical protein